MLTLFTERFSPSGGVAAEGVRKLLGTPQLTLLQTVIRETVQNSWDARLDGGPVGYKVRLRRLSTDQRGVLASQVLTELSGPRMTSIREFLDEQAPLVMEISDWNTSGLAGPTRADVASDPDEPSDFVNFIRNIGAARDIHHGGGTYGYGKSALYLASRCSAIVVDSLAATKSGPERRLIACHLGDAFDDDGGRGTGRYWWGVPADQGDYVEPATDNTAVDLARGVGFLERSRHQTGTTILILAPVLPCENLAEAAGHAVETLLWFCWPKMLVSTGQPAAMNFSVEVEERPVGIPSPDQVSPLDLFAEAYKAVKTSGSDRTVVQCRRPIRTLGHMAIRRGFRNPRQYVVPDEDSLIPHTCAHIAVMRPAELVVRYFEGRALANDLQEWAGVFICDEDDEVERAFAEAEPPAHDDWVPDMLPKGHTRTFVNVAIREIRSAAASYASPPLQVEDGLGDQPPLARAAQRLGQILPELTPRGGARPTGGGSRQGRAWRVTEPVFVQLADGDAGPEATFEFRAANNSEGELSLKARPGIVVDGGLLLDEHGPDGSAAKVIRWEDSEGHQISANDQLSVAAGENKTCRVTVSVPPATAISVLVEASQEEQPS